MHKITPEFEEPDFEVMIQLFAAAADIASQHIANFSMADKPGESRAEVRSKVFGKIEVVAEQLRGGFWIRFNDRTGKSKPMMLREDDEIQNIRLMLNLDVNDCLETAHISGRGRRILSNGSRGLVGRIGQLKVYYTYPVT
jgi:molybdopterin converting factor small subunit